MYSTANPDVFNSKIQPWNPGYGPRTRAMEPRPKIQPWNPGYGPKARAMEPRPRDTPQPMAPRAPHWLGMWKPRYQVKTQTMGHLGDATSADPESYAPAAPAASGWSGLWSGLASILTPAAQTYVGIRTQAALSQATQRAQAQTWNPNLTGPAIAAQGWQNAYQSGSGLIPSVGVGTMVAVGLGIAGLLYITRKK